MMAMTSQQMRTGGRHPGIVYPNDDDEQHSSFILRARCGRWVVLFLHQVRYFIIAAGETAEEVQVPDRERPQ